MRPGAQRAAHLLCEIRQRLADVGLSNDRSFDLPLTQQHLADALGLSVVHVNRVLQVLKKLGLLQIRTSHVQIADLEKLETFAEFDKGYLQLPARETVQETSDSGIFRANLSRGSDLQTLGTASQH